MSNLFNNNLYSTVNFNNGQYECSSSGSSCSCDYHSDSSIPEWDDLVQNNGELFFVKCSPITTNLNSNDESIHKCDTNRSKKNKLSTFLQRHKIKKHHKKDHIDKIISQENEIHPSSQVGTSDAANFENTPPNSAAILYLNVQIVENNELSNDNTIYHFPQNTSENTVNSIRGALLTLYHLLPKLVNEKPEISSIFIKEELVHIIYIGEGEELMVIAFPSDKCTLSSLKQTSLNIRRFLSFKYGSLHNNSANFKYVNQFFSNIFGQLLKNANDSFILKTFPKNETFFQIEDLFSFPCLLSIPTGLETKIHEKLNEIEANDFGDLSEDHYGCRRLFTLIGTCLYYKGYLIITHLNREDLLDVHIFLRYNEILDLSVNSYMESLVVWQEIFLSSNPSVEKNQSIPLKRRWFLLVIGKEQGLLITLFESGGCSTISEGPIRPDELYVEQIQEIMNDILHYNLSGTVDQLTEFNHFNSQKSMSNESTENLMNSHLGTMKKLQDYEMEFNPHHHSSSVQITGNEGDAFSESPSHTSSLFSDEIIPVIGRRAQRMKQLNNSGSIYSLSHSTLSNSDQSDYDTTGSSHSSSFIEIHKNCNKISNNAKRIIHGDEQDLFYYLNLNSNRGIILCSTNAYQTQIYQKYSNIMKNFKLSVQRIHEILSKKEPLPIGKFQRNNLSVKEYGLLFECYNDEDDFKQIAPISYWIVGRSFNKAHLGEIYVCYKDKTPQNLIEIAFRLAMSF